MKKGIYILIISMLVLAGGLILPVSRIMAETDNAEVDNDSCGDQEELVEETKITQTSHTQNGIRTLKNQYFSPQSILK